MQSLGCGWVLRTAGAVIFLSLGLASSLGAQETPQDILVDEKLLADDGVEGDNFGASLAIEGDTLVIAAPWAEIDGVERSGAVYVFGRNPATGAWLEQQRLMPNDGNYDSIEMSVAIKGDTIVVGASHATLAAFQEGAVYVFERDDADTWHQVAKLTDASVGFGGHFGISVALAGDLLAIGADMQPTSNGKVTIFERDRGGPDPWGQVATLHDSVIGDGGTLEAFGSVLAIAGDLLLVGAERADVSAVNENDGAAYLFRPDEADPDRWNYVQRLVVPESDACVGGLTIAEFLADPESDLDEMDRCRREDGKSDHDNFGGAVAFDGETIVVGALSAEGADGSYSVGAAHVFQPDPDDPAAWHHVAKLDPGETTRYFGGALALDGDTIVVGAYGTTIESRELQGAVYVFGRDADGAWNHAEKLIAHDGLSYTYFGEALALDGSTRVIGAKGHQAARGAVYLHEPALPEEPEGPPTPAYPPTGELVNDSVLEDPSGVILGGVEGTILPTLPVWIHEVSAPTEPLFSGAGPIGSYFNIGAVETTRLPNDTPFAIGLPVPSGANPSRLALAMLMSSDHVLDGTSTGMVWMPVIGTYDAEHALYVVVMAGLLIEGSTVVLIEHPDLPTDPPENAAAAPNGAPVPQRLVGTSSNFEVNCYLADCGETLQRTLERAYAEYGKAFTEPHLSRKWWRFCSEQIFCSLGGTGPFNGVNLFPEQNINPNPSCDGGDAATAAISKTINFCIEVANHTYDYFDATVSHELYHAYQFSLDPIWYQFAKHQMQYWVMEATAAAAAGSLTPVVSPPGSSLLRDWTGRLAVRRIDFSLTVPNEPLDVHNYEAQDFWVYMGQVRQQNLGYLRYMIAEGVTAADVDRRIALHFNSSLADEYWMWVKNQVMLEDDINFFPDGLGPNPPPLDQPPCRIQPKAVKHDEATLALILDHTMTISQPGHDSIGVPLLPLQSNVVEITFASGTTAPVRISATGAGHRYKVYLDQPADVDGNACRNVPDGERTIGGPLPPGAKAYVLLSNTTYLESGASTYEVRVDIFD